MDQQIAEQLTQLQDLINIQANSGNWDYDPYMFGLLNGMLLARSLLDGEDPGFKEAPNMWLADYAELEKLSRGGVEFTDVCMIHRPRAVREEDII